MTENTTPNTQVGKYALNEQFYQWLKQFAQLVFPAAITLYVTLGEIWDWSYRLEVAGTLGAINVFLGIALKISTSSYNNAQEAGAKYDGTIVVAQSPEPAVNPKTGEMQLDQVPKSLDIGLTGNEISKKDEIRIKVVQEEPTNEQ